MKPYQIVLGTMALMIVVPVGCSLISTANSVTTAPGRVVQKTMQTDNVIQNYEAFFDVKAQYDARVAQITDHSGVLASETDAAEQRRLRMEVSAMRQSCRQLAARYNADAVKLNRAVFRSGNLPETLSAQACEA
jgi:hypothetical protein